MSNRETSAEVARIAGIVLNLEEMAFVSNVGAIGLPMFESLVVKHNELLKQAKTLAGSALSQREVEPQAGTHAYDLLAAFAKADVDNTVALIELVAATVLYKLIDEEGGGRSNITFSPKDMDDMIRSYEIESGHEGLITTVKISPREKSVHGMFFDPDPTTATSTHDQAQPKDERPVWAIRWFDDAGQPHLHRMHDRADAERQIASYHRDGVPNGDIENRMCMHIDCPSTRCNH